MPGDESPQSISQKEMDLWSRVVGKRRAGWKSLPRNELLHIIQAPWSSEHSTPSIEDPCEQVEWLLNANFHRSIDRKVPPNTRRASYSRVDVLLSRLDAATERWNREKNALNMELSVENGSSGQVNVPQSSSPRASIRDGMQSKPPNSNPNGAPQALAVVANQPPSGTKAQSSPSNSDSQQTASFAPNSSETRKPTPQLQPSQPEREPSSPPPQRQEWPPQREPSPSQPQREPSPPQPQGQQSPPQPQLQAQRQQSPPQREPSPPQRQQSQPQSGPPSAHLASRNTSVLVSHTRPPSTTPPKAVAHPANGHKAPNGMGSNFSSAARVAPAEPNSAAQWKANATPTPSASPPQRSAPVTVLFAADTQRFTCALEPRSNLRVTFTPVALAKQEMPGIIERFRTWDPYWKIEHQIALTQTFKVDKCENLKYGSRPFQATECDVTLDRRFAGLVRDWGKPRRTRTYVQGEMRVLVRMLPLNVAQKKRPRADTHLWPKGTFVQLNGMPIQIEQRRQQSHDPKEWKYMSYMLDLTTRIVHPTNVNKLQLCFLDEDPYIISVALCSYVAPDTLYETAMNKWVEMLSIEEAKARANRNANQQTVVLEDADTEQGMNSFIFPLSCPISQQLLVTPVRGRTCKHWQCFDLGNFLESNAHVTGTRWECPVCSKLLSCRDLQHCPLTASLLKEYENEAKPNRDRVQFFSNGTYKLLGEAKKRYAKKRPATNENGDDNKRARSDGSIPLPGSPEVIDLL